MATVRSRTAPLPPEVPYSTVALAGWRRSPSNVAVIDILHNEQVTFAQLEHLVLRVAGKMQRAGVRAQSRVQFFAENSLASLVAMQAALFCNATVALCNFEETALYGEYRQDTDEADLQFIVTDVKKYNRLVHRYLEERRGSPSPRVLLVKGSHPGSLHPAASFIDDLDEGRFVEPPVRVREDVLLLMYTSGSTGRPKGVMHCHYGFIASLQGMHHIGMYGPHDRYLQTSSLTYVSGTIFPAGVLAHSGTVVLADTSIEADFPRVVETHQPTVALLLEVPARNVIQAASRYPDSARMMSSLRLILPSGTVFPEPLQRAVEKAFPNAQFAQLYGMTECIGPLVASDPQPTISARVGYAMPNMQIRVVNENGDPTKVGEPGEVLLNGPQKTLGFWRRLSDDFTADGFYRTGDVGVVDEHGELTLLGRNKQFIICLDSRVAPTEIENVLLEHAEVDEAVVIGLPHPEYQQAPTAVVVRKAGSVSDEQLKMELVDLVASRLSPYRRLHGGVYFVQSLEKTRSGKYAREAITRRIQALVEAQRSVRD